MNWYFPSLTLGYCFILTLSEVVCCSTWNIIDISCLSQIHLKTKILMKSIFTSRNFSSKSKFRSVKKITWQKLNLFIFIKSINNTYKAISTYCLPEKKGARFWAIYILLIWMFPKVWEASGQNWFSIHGSCISVRTFTLFGSLESM